MGKHAGRTEVAVRGRATPFAFGTRFRTFASVQFAAAIASAASFSFIFFMPASMKSRHTCNTHWRFCRASSRSSACSFQRTQKCLQVRSNSRFIHPSFTRQSN